MPSLGDIPPQWLGLPGYVDYFGVQRVLRDPTDLGLAPKLRELKYRDLIDARCVIAGSPTTVRDQLAEAIKDLCLGNLLLQVQIGSMPHELVLKNIDLFAREVLPHLHEIWDADGWQHEWWPRPLRQEKRAPQPV